MTIGAGRKYTALKSEVTVKLRFCGFIYTNVLMNAVCSDVIQNGLHQF